MALLKTKRLNQRPVLIVKPASTPTSMDKLHANPVQLDCIPTKLVWMLRQDVNHAQHLATTALKELLKRTNFLAKQVPFRIKPKHQNATRARKDNIKRPRVNLSV